MIVEMFLELITIRKICLSIFSFIFIPCFWMSLFFMITLFLNIFKIQSASFTGKFMFSNTVFHQQFLRTKYCVIWTFGSLDSIFVELLHMKYEQFLSCECWRWFAWITLYNLRMKIFGVFFKLWFCSKISRGFTF